MNKIEGTFVILKRLEPSLDAEELYNASHGKNQGTTTSFLLLGIWKYRLQEPFKSVDEFQQYLIDISSQNELFCIISKRSGEKIGLTGFLNDKEEHREIELGASWF